MPYFFLVTSSTFNDMWGKNITDESIKDMKTKDISAVLKPTLVSVRKLFKDI